jgi:hypothetical protein
MKTDPDWLLMEGLSKTFRLTGPPARRLRQLALAVRRKRAVVAKAEVEALLRLLCRYRRVASLFSMLESEKVAALLASRENLMQVAETLMEAMAALPLILNQEQYHKWRFQLSDFWRRIPADQCDDERDIYRLHETLLGRGLTFARSLPADVGEVSWNAYQGLFAEEDLASLLTSNVQLLHSANRASIWGIRTLRAALAAARRDFVFASVTLLGYRADEFSIVVFRSSGLGFVDRLKDASWHLIREAKAVASIQTQYSKIAWPECSGLEAVAAKILEGAAALRLEPSWILLAIEPGMARVPWQDLLRRLGFRGGVALIPSAEWLVRVTGATHRRSPHESVEVIVPLDADRFAALPAGGYDVTAAELCNEIGNDLGRLRKNFDDAIFALGHGTWDPARHLTLFHESAEPTEGDLLAPNLAKLSDKEIVVIHACSAGRVVLKTLGDFDGLAAACLARRTRAFLAPVAKVSAKTAQTLHRHLVATTTPPTALGERYLAALEEDPRVALYTYYGLPWLAKGTAK